MPPTPTFPDNIGLQKKGNVSMVKMAIKETATGRSSCNFPTTLLYNRTKDITAGNAKIFTIDKT